MPRGLRSRLVYALLAVAGISVCWAVPDALAQPPYTLTIQNVMGSSNVSCSGSPTLTCVATGDGAVLSTTDLDNYLADVTDPTITQVVIGDSTTTTIVLDDSVTGSNPLEFAEPVETANAPTLTAPTVQFDQALSGAADLTITGNAVFDGTVGGGTALTSLSVSGTTILGGSVSTSGDQTYQGAVTLNTGVAFSSGTTIQVEQPVGGPGSIAMIGTGLLELESASNNYSGGTAADAGTVEFANGGLGTGNNVTLDGGTLEWAPGNTQDISPDLEIGPLGGTLDTDGNSVSFAGAPGGAGGTLVKAGAGTLSLDASSGAYGSQISVVGGWLSVVGTTVTTPITVESGGTLSCTSNPPFLGTLTGGVTNNGGTLFGGPNTPAINAVTDNGPNATVRFTASDANNCYPIRYVAQTTSGGLASGPGTSSPLTVGNLAPSTTYTFTVTATNPLGSATSASSRSVTTPNPPSVAITSPTNGAAYAFNQTVDAQYACTDGNGPGISACQGPAASGGALDTSTPGQHSFTVTATSSDGFTSTGTVNYSVAQPLPPVITIVNPTSGSTYAHNQVVDASYSCLDSTLGTGIASCTGSSASGSPIDTTTGGSHTFTVVATSKDGATATLSVTYAVVAPSNFFTLLVNGRPHGSINVSLGDLRTPGVVKLTIRRPTAPAFKLMRTIRSGASFTFTLSATSRLRRFLSAARHSRPRASVTVTYTPRGGFARAVTTGVRLLR